MVSLDIAQNGSAVLGVPDKESEIKHYRIRPVEAGYWCRSFELARMDMEHIYRIDEHDPGDWSCSCPSYKFRKDRAETCKHIISIRALLDFFATLETQHASAEYR